MYFTPTFRENFLSPGATPTDRRTIAGNAVRCKWWNTLRSHSNILLRLRCLDEKEAEEFISEIDEGRTGHAMADPKAGLLLEYARNAANMSGNATLLLKASSRLHQSSTIWPLHGLSLFGVSMWLEESIRRVVAIYYFTKWVEAVSSLSILSLQTRFLKNYIHHFSIWSALTDNGEFWPRSRLQDIGPPPIIPRRMVRYLEKMVDWHEMLPSLWSRANPSQWASFSPISLGGLTICGHIIWPLTSVYTECLYLSIRDVSLSYYSISFFPLLLLNCSSLCPTLRCRRTSPTF